MMPTTCSDYPAAFKAACDSCRNGACLPKVEPELGTMLPDLCLEARVSCQDLHAEHAELVLDGAQLPQQTLKSVSTLAGCGHK